MKLNCRKRGKRLDIWHRWFAWTPVEVAHGDCRWLEWVERKGEHFGGMGADWWQWEYRLPKGSANDREG